MLKMDATATLPRRILVVDDEPYVCDALKMLLTLDGHEVVTANAGAEALALFNQGRFDLMITDYSMPGMKGDELAAAVKSRNPGQPIIMITAYVEKLSGGDSPLVNVNELVAKPFRLEEIKRAMERALNGTEPSPA